MLKLLSGFLLLKKPVFSCSGSCQIDLFKESSNAYKHKILRKTTTLQVTWLTTWSFSSSGRVYYFCGSILFILCFFLWLICQEKCLLHGIIVHKEEHAMMIGGRLSMETISTIETGAWMWIGAATTTTSGIIAISVISPRGNSGTMSMVMLTLLLLDQLLKGENLVWILGENVVGDTTLSTMHMNALINQLTTIQPLWSQDPMLRSLHLHLWVANVNAQNWKKMNQYFCQRMRLRDTPHQEKMELMHYVKHICGILIVPSFRILGCGWSCKCSTWNVSRVIIFCLDAFLSEFQCY